MILVTGGTGLLGSHLLLQLVLEQTEVLKKKPLEAPVEVLAIKRPSSDLEEVKRVFGYYLYDPDELEDLFGRIRWIDVDLLNLADMARAMEGVQEVYHCAAMVSFQPRERQKMIRLNTGITETMVNASQATGVKKLVHVSSTAAIGRPPEGSPATEAMIWAHSKTSTGYAESKFRSEMEVWRGIEEGLEAVIVNPSIILGAGFWDRGSSSLFDRVAKGLKYATSGVTGYVGVQDVVSAMIRLMQSDISGERFILSEGDHSYAEVFGMIGQSMGRARDLKPATPSLLNLLTGLDAIAAPFRGRRLITSEHVSAAFGEVHFSSEKIKSALHFKFTPLKQVIAEVAAQYSKDHLL